jgi:hypothetical protein
MRGVRYSTFFGGWSDNLDTPFGVGLSGALACLVGGGDTDRVVLDSGFVLLLEPKSLGSEGGKVDEDEMSDGLAVSSSPSSSSDTAWVRSTVELFSRRRLRSPFSRPIDAVDGTVGTCTGVGACSCEKRQLVSLHVAAPAGHGICLKSSEENILCTQVIRPVVLSVCEYRNEGHA